MWAVAGFDAGCLQHADLMYGSTWTTLTVLYYFNTSVQSHVPFHEEHRATSRCAYLDAARRPRLTVQQHVHLTMWQDTSNLVAAIRGEY